MWGTPAPGESSSSLPTEGHSYNASSSALVFSVGRPTGSIAARGPGFSTRSKFPPPSSQSFSGVSSHLEPTSLSLIHLFTTHTAASLSIRKIVHTLWSVNVPRQALRLARNKPETQSYLLYSLLSLAALHAAALLAQRNGPRARGRVKKWVIIASSYHQSTIGGFRRAVDEYATSMNIRDSREELRIREGGAEDTRPGQISHGSTPTGEQLSPQLTKEEVDTNEAILMASTCLAIYAVAWSVISSLELGSQDLDADSLRSGGEPIPGSPIEATPLACSPSTPATLLSWLPLIRGTPTMLRVFPTAWPILSRGHLAPILLLGEPTPNHKYLPQINNLHEVFRCYPHQSLPQPTHPLTKAVFDHAWNLLKECYSNFYTTCDPMTVAMIFPSTVEDEFICSVLGDGGGSYGGHAKAPPGTLTSGDLDNCRRDPRALVVMGWFMVLLAEAEKLFPNDLEAKDILVDFDEVDDEDGGLDVPGKLEMDSREVSGSQAGPAGIAQAGSDSRAPSCTWWFAGVAKREVEGILRYLRALDDEEWRVDGARSRRWERWMDWPLEMVNKPHCDKSAFNSPVSPSVGFGTSAVI